MSSSGEDRFYDTADETEESINYSKADINE